MVRWLEGWGMGRGGRGRRAGLWAAAPQPEHLSSRSGSMLHAMQHTPSLLSWPLLPCSPAARTPLHVDPRDTTLSSKLC